MESNKVLLPTVTGLRSYQASIMAKKYLETEDWEEVRLSSNNDNIFDASRSSTSNRYVHNMIKLMKNLNKDQLEVIATGEEKDRLTFLWLGFCLAYSIVGEFTSTVLCKKVMNKNFKLKAEDLWEFIADKAIEHEDLADISKAVRSKFKCVVFYNLRDAGYLNSVDEIQYARLSKEARDLIDDEYICFFPGEEK